MDRNGETYLSVKEMAAYLGVSNTSAYAWAKSRGLQGVRFQAPGLMKGRRTFYRLTDIDQCKNAIVEVE